MKKIILILAMILPILAISQTGRDFHNLDASTFTDTNLVVDLNDAKNVIVSIRAENLDAADATFNIKTSDVSYDTLQFSYIVDSELPLTIVTDTLAVKYTKSYWADRWLIVEIKNNAVTTGNYIISTSYKR